jgi:hypothetical protein
VQVQEQGKDERQNVGGEIAVNEVCGMNRKAFVWVPPQAWTCPQCGRVELTTDLAPRCQTCGFYEGE